MQHNPPTHNHPSDHRLNGFTYLNLTKLDVLSDLDEIKIGVAYRTADGKELPTVPCDLEVLESVEVVYETVPGWKTDISTVCGCGEDGANMQVCSGDSGANVQVCSGTVCKGAVVTVCKGAVVQWWQW